MRLYPALRPLLFTLPPEQAHGLTLRALSGLAHVPGGLAALRRAYRPPRRPVRAFGLTFPSPVGLAAGYDKDALAVRGLAALGFGHLEIGTVTPKPQPGNPSPRLFRLPSDRAVINRMGFPSQGAAAVAERLRRLKTKRDWVLGVNIGKNKETPNEAAVQDYLTLLETFAPLADYLTVNISSPNTAGLRDLQHRAQLEALLEALAQRRAAARPTGKRLPILVKLSPDLSPAQLDAALEAIVRTGMDGVILTNTTVSRPGLRHPAAAEGGGLSGAPLQALSEQALTRTVRWLDGRLPVVSVGGVMQPQDVQRRLDLGATLVQLFTGLIYYGPSLARDSLRLVSLSAS